MRSYPNAAALAAYNVTRDGMLSGGMLNEYFLSCAIVDPIARPLRHDEVNRVHAYAHKSIAKYVHDSNLPLLTAQHVKVWSRDNIGEPEGDRTIPIVFTEPAMVDRRFVSYLQCDILRRFNDWRIRHCEDSDRCDLNLAIYPDAISIGGEMYAGGIDERLSDWRRDLETFQVHREGWFRRQLKVVEGIVATKPEEEWRQASPSVLTAFDCCGNDPSVMSLWLIVDGTSPFDYEIDCNDMTEGNWYPLMAKGMLGEVDAANSQSKLWVRHVAYGRGCGARLKLRGRNRSIECDISRFFSLPK